MKIQAVANTTIFLLSAIYGWCTFRNFLLLNLDGFEPLIFAASGTILCLFLFTYFYLIGRMLGRWILLGGYSLFGVASGALLAGGVSGQADSSFVTIGMNIMMWGSAVCLIGQWKIRTE